MATTATATTFRSCTLSFSIGYSNNVDTGPSNQNTEGGFSYTLTFANSTGAGNLNLPVIEQEHTLAAAANETINLASLTTQHGDTIATGAVARFVVIRLTGGAGPLTIGNNAANDFTGAQSATSESYARINMPWVWVFTTGTTFGANNLIKVVNSGGDTATYTVIVGVATA